MQDKEVRLYEEIFIYNEQNKMFFDKQTHLLKALVDGDTVRALTLDRIFKRGTIYMDTMDNEKIITNEAIYLSENKKIYMLIKRAFDIFLSLIALLFLSPLFIIIGIIIKSDGAKGKVFFYQDRVGINGSVFRIYKFRTMYPDAEERLEQLIHLNEIEGNMFKMKKDPRVTKIGKFLRAYSIDELPQLINVLKGDMSLIGPRPPLINEYEKYTDYDKKRLAITPGITGLWQVSGRNSLNFDEMVALDLKYIRTLCMKNDTIIFFKTVVVVLKKENAF